MSTPLRGPENDLPTSETLWDGWFSTQYGQMYMHWGSNLDFAESLVEYFAGQVNGLVGVVPRGHGVVNLAGWLGGRVRVLLHSSEPPVRDEWEDVVEVSLVIPEGEQFGLVPWGGGQVFTLPELVPASYRLRVSFRDREAGRQDERSGDHLLEFWEAPPAPDAILRTTTDNAAYWHRACGTRREEQ